MKLLRLYIFFIFIVSALFAGAQIQPGAKPQTVVIRAGTLLDGKGHELHNMFIVVMDGKIQGVVPIDKVQWATGRPTISVTGR